MKKNLLNIFIKIFISGLFLFIVFREINIHLLLNVLKHSSKPIIVFMFLLNVLLTFLLASRWHAILKVFDKKSGYPYVWKLTMLGLFFNLFLPTGSGGDIARIYYLVKKKEEKLKLGISVFFDRFIGSCSVITMGVIAAVFFRKHIPAQAVSAIIIIFIILLLGWLIIIWNELAKILGRYIPFKIRDKIITFYYYLRNYGMKWKNVLWAILISFLVQGLSIVMQYFIVKAIVPHSVFMHISMNLFFIFVPLIWTLQIIPSIGGLGVREFSYFFFFTPYIGKEHAIALDVIVFFLTITQSLLGGIVFLIHKERSGRK
ncbi:MAG: flippase-like domain-containing protein [Candidatus Omnitrophica bacterium]|nr:flippase-like domain-containing protein [Candidatus Omnitrophota bacterium]